MFPWEESNSVGINTVRDFQLNVCQVGVSEYDSGEGLPYAPVDWPYVGDNWGWRAGKRVTSSSTFRDRYLYLPKHFKDPKCGKKNSFRSKISVKKYLQSEYPDIDVNQFFASFSWMIPSKQSPSSKVSLVFAETVAVSFAAKLSVRTMMDCALRAYMAGTVGGSINLDAQYLCGYCDSRMDLVPHALKLLNTCTSVASRADIEKILNVGICILRGSQKRNGKELLHRIESIKAKI
ncbi:hypothetical protein KY284_036351 [Solanum tuberosum]|nr:hypothetical protein KY284_036351 [Solanum tuberosum]